MTYWHMQLHPYNYNWDGEKELLEKIALIGLGVTDDNINYDDKQNRQFIENMKIGDIVLIRYGNTPKALVEVIGEVEDIGKNDYNRLDWFRYRRKVKVLDFANEDIKKFPQSRGALQRLVNKKTPSYQYIHNWYTQILQKDYDKEELIEGTYKLKELYIKDNQKTFQDFKIDCTSDGKNPLPLIIIAGKNGTGKTTLLEYLANFEIQKDDYLEIFKVREVDGLELDDIDNGNLIVDSFHIRDGMKGIQSKKKEYMEHIEYLPVYSSKIKDVKDFILRRHRQRSRELDSISKATKEIGDFIEKIFDGMDLSFSLVDVDDTDRDNEKVTFKNKNGKEFDINNLSTGEKTLLSKVLYLYFKDIKNQIILIDEPELSLHPAWQNRVLKLYENFAKENNCQIIIATHSPHIIYSAKNEYIRLLTEDGVVNDVLAYGRDIEWVLKEVMGANYTREPVISKKIQECQELLNEDRYDEAEEFIDALEVLIGANDREILALRNSLEFWRE